MRTIKISNPKLIAIIEALIEDKKIIHDNIRAGRPIATGTKHAIIAHPI